MDILSGFKITFNELIRDANISVKDLSKQLCTRPSVVSEWKNKSVDVKLKTLLKIADYFDCSLEYLCGKTVVYLDYEPKTCPKFGERVVTVLKENGCSSYKLFKETAIKPAQYHHWRTGTEPLLSSLEIISEYLGVTIDYLVGRDC